MLVTNLKPKFSANKSYYGKAKVITLDNGVKMLQSYETIVAVVLPKDEQGCIEVVLPWMWWSATTGRHTFDFLMQNGVKINSCLELGYKSFAAFMREVSTFQYSTKQERIINVDDSGWVRPYQYLNNAVKNWENL